MAAAEVGESAAGNTVGGERLRTLNANGHAARWQSSAKVRTGSQKLRAERRIGCSLCNKTKVGKESVFIGQ
jgi:hypothetical protein